MIMATEADTSGSEMPVASNSENQYRNISHNRHQQHHHFQPHIIYHSDVSSSNLRNHGHLSDELVDGGSDDMDKLISVDEFDDSDDDDIQSCSSASPTPSDHAINSGISSRQYSSSANSVSHKLQKKRGLASKVIDEQELQSLRLKINSRERKRMHDLNSALDGLREVMPYAHGPSVRKLSKIATLLLAKNYILMLNSSLEEMKKLVSDIYHSQGQPRPTSRQLASQALVLPNAPATASSSGNGSVTKSSSDNSTSSLHNHSLTPTRKAAESPHSFSHPPTIPITPLPAHQTVTLMAPLAIPALRAAVPGLIPHDLTSSYDFPKSESNSAQGISHVYAGHERAHIFHRWPVPCACAQCLSGSSHLPAGLHLSRFSYPLLTSSSFLHRKN